MKIDMRDIYAGIYIAAEKKIKQSLEKEGFIVFSDNGNEKFDIYAEKGDDRRIYEIRIGKSKIQERLLSSLQELARKKKAKLFVIYVEPPRTKQIEYDGIDLLLSDYLINNMPDDLNELSTHTLIEYVSDTEINSIHISDFDIEVEGNSCVSVCLLYGSDLDRRNGDGDESSDIFEFSFKAIISDNKITKADFRFDVEHFYE